MDRIQPVNISAFIIPPSYHHTDCRPVRGMGLVQPIVAETSWVGGKILISICRMAEWSQEGKSHSWRSVGWKTYCLGTTEFRLCFPGAWVVMTWLCPCWIVDLYSVWISWWLHCEGPHSLRSVYPAAGASPELPCSEAGHSTMDCRKEKPMNSIRIKLRRNLAGNAVFVMGWPCAWEASFHGCSCWDQRTQGLYTTFPGKSHLGGPKKCAIVLHSSDLVDFSNWKKAALVFGFPSQTVFSESNRRDVRLRKSSQVAWCASKRLPVN